MNEWCPSPANLPGSHMGAAQSLVAPLVVKSVDYLNRVHKVSRDGSDPDIVDFATAFLRDLQRRSMPFFVHCYVRSNAQQDTLYSQGVTKARAGQSPHNWGMACDIVHFGRFWELTQKEWAVVGEIGKEAARRRNIKITWGGDWKFYDPAHWELTDWKKRITHHPVEDFRTAFAKARAQGLSKFVWQGREYTTEIA